MGRAVKLPESDVTEYVPAKRTNRVALDVTEDAPAKRSKRVDPPAELEEEDPAAAAFLLANEITFHDADSPLPCMSFETAPFPKKLIKLLIAQPGFKAPSAVQAASWPLAVAGRDVLAIAKTGSGKTLGYLLPALTRCRLEKADANGSPICLIMAPTRELAIQICSEAVKFGEPLGCRAVAVYGGASKKTQSNNLQRGCEVIAATPGRMKDMLDIRGNGYNAVTSLTKCSILLLDEADRMLDMGFETEIRSIVWEIPTPHQTLFYSATWPAEVECIAQDLLTNPAKVSVGSGGEKLTANKSVTQRVHVVNLGFALFVCCFFVCSNLGSNLVVCLFESCCASLCLGLSSGLSSATGAEDKLEDKLCDFGFSGKKIRQLCFRVFANQLVPEFVLKFVLGHRR
ncbi:unnamed protein product [Polarella glacialis]|uniref:RNA helicase n=1 Tax=Polarella glacialis TaxID=89957 RepID=A0A813KHF1_POLGL|nr:unnamed protein product [Polarella glacialis]